MPPSHLPATGRRCRIGIDVGGTFTDFVLADLESGALTRHKEPSVPSDPSRSVERGIPPLLELAGVAPGEVELIVHGTTLLVNAIIQRRGARVGMLVSKGHRGLMEIGRGRLDNTYDLLIVKEPPLVPRDLILETSARIGADGRVIARPDEAEIVDAARVFAREGVEAVTVVLLHAYAHPQMEREVAAMLRRHLPGVRVSESAAVWPERREFERGLVAVMNAYVQPLMEDYLDRLTARVAGLGVRAPIYITASNGGTLSVATARQRPIETILSGPASGVVAAMRAADGRERLITVDMGGTSADVAITLGHEPEYTTLTHIGGLPLVLPVVNVSAIGAGGGSIVWVDPQGVLKVGPHSAGADPGPVCYGLGGREPTVTDCYLVQGYIDPDHFLGGRMRLDRAAARAALGRLAARLGFEGEDAVERTAEAALRIATAMMATELHKGLAGRGLDPDGFALMAFGGAGPTHATLLAREARLRTVLIPPAPATFCAMGAILADVKRDYVHSRHLFLEDGDAAMAALADILAGLEQEGRAWIAEEGELLGEPRFVATLDMRYAGQAFDLPVILPDELRRAPQAPPLVEAFHQAHERTYGFRDPDSAVEITTLRLRVVGRIPPIALPRLPAGSGRAPEPTGHRRVFQDGAWAEVPVHLRRDLAEGDEVTGPAIVEQRDCTLWIVAGWHGRVDAIGNIVLGAPAVPSRTATTGRVDAVAVPTLPGEL